MTLAEVRLMKFHEDKAAKKQRFEEEKKAEMRLIYRPNIVESKPMKELDDKGSMLSQKETVDRVEKVEKAGSYPSSEPSKRKIIDEADVLALKQFHVPIPLRGSAHNDEAEKGHKNGDTIDEQLLESKEVTNEVTNAASYKKILKRAAIDSSSSPFDQHEDEEDDLHVLFSPMGLLSDVDWNPQQDPQTKEFLLHNFGLDKYQTLGIRLTIPPDSKRWSVNIGPPIHRDLCDIFFHFNPRCRAREVICNDKQGTWGKSKKEPLSFKQVGVIDLVIQVRIPAVARVIARVLFSKAFKL